jgi:hypothetical protein
VSLLLHAITTLPEAPSEQLPVRGLGSQPLTRVDTVALSTWTSEWSGARELTRGDVLDHHRIVTEVFARVDACLPARFPTLLDSARLEALVAQRYDEVFRQLERVRGACELAITAVWASPEELTPIPAELSPGRRYLLERQRTISASERRGARATELANALENQLAPLTREIRTEVCPSHAVALSAALLVPTANLGEAKSRLPRTQADVRILVNGPWPPYTFASLRSD